MSAASRGEKRPSPPAGCFTRSRGGMSEKCETEFGLHGMTNQEIIQYFYEVLVSENKIEELSSIVSSQCCLRVGDDVSCIGARGMAEHIIATKRTYPDYTIKIIRQYCDGEYVISEFLMAGTHEGEWLGIKPSRQKLTFTGVNIDRVIDGKIVEHGGAVNTFETLLAANLITAK